MAERRVERRADDEHARSPPGDPLADRLEQLRAADRLVRDHQHRYCSGACGAGACRTGASALARAHETHQSTPAVSTTNTATPSQTLITDPITISAK